MKNLFQKGKLAVVGGQKYIIISNVLVKSKRGRLVVRFCQQTNLVKIFTKGECV